MLQHKVAVEQYGLNLSQKRIMTVDVRPARLDHADSRVGKMMNGPQEEIFRRNKVGIKDGKEFSTRLLHAFLERPCFEAVPVRALGSRARDRAEREHAVFRRRAAALAIDLSYLPGWSARPGV